MDMCYDGALVMPSNYAVMDEEEMMYVEGGTVTFSCSRIWLSKNRCLTSAASLKSSGKVKGMEVKDIAKEIFAHAYSFYNYAKVASVMGIAIAAYCYSKAANGITITDGGDTGLRKTAYDSFWNIFPTNSYYG